METLRTVDEMTARADGWRRAGLRVGLVPTMGYLHRGHTSLMDALRGQVDRLVVSVFVNPLQFGPTEDLARYPRDPDGDARRCAEAGVDALFMPDALYPAGFSTAVRVSGLTEGLCGASRPGHFEGVTTVVCRLFGVTRCDVAIFGEKDYQQLAVIRRMTRDLGLPVEVLGGALVRDDDGLALSSRNVYLSPDERRRALSLVAALRAVIDAADRGERDADALRTVGRARLDVDRVDYLDVVDASSLAPLTRLDRPARALVAAFVGRTRLLDNVALEGAWS
ncbi:MAG TPA: pantoate--beta-alanine ligase [Myxococcota bacterium]|nr:pantoate--beta-alanine ligase [Myxococcota bacterium]